MRTPFVLLFAALIQRLLRAQEAKLGRTVVGLAVGLTLLISAQAVQATSIVLTGGDPGEGYAPLPNTFGALTLGGSGSALVVQGVSFAVSDPNIAVASGINTPVALIALGSSVDDDNLESILSQAIFANAGPIVFTVSGLTIGKLYQLDYFIEFLGSPRTYQFSAQGVGGPIIDTLAYGGAATPIDIRQLVSPDATGTIVVTASSIAGFANPLINGFSVTVPEPSTALLLAFGLLGLGGRRRLH